MWKQKPKKLFFNFLCSSATPKNVIKKIFFEISSETSQIANLFRHSIIVILAQIDVNFEYSRKIKAHYLREEQSCKKLNTCQVNWTFQYKV